MLVDARPGFVQRIRLHEMLAGSEPSGLDYARTLGRRGIAFVQAAIENGINGRMPAGILAGAQAEEVADFVGREAGQ